MRHIFRDPSEELHRRVLEDLGGAAGPLPALPPAAPILQLRGQTPSHLAIILYITSFNIQTITIALPLYVTTFITLRHWSGW